MKELVMKKLASWLVVLSLASAPALAVYAPGLSAGDAQQMAEAETEYAAQEEESAAPEKESAAPEEESAAPEEDNAAEEDAAEAVLLDAAGNVELAPYVVDNVQRGYYVKSCPANVTAAVIPAEYNGQSVVHIGRNAFDGHKNLVSVVIPDSVETIGSSAFYGCSSLASITLPASVVLQANNPFNYSCSSIDGLSVHFTPGTGAMADYTNTYSWTPWYSAAYYNKPVTVVIDDGVTSIGAYVFRGCDDLKSVTVGKDVSAVGDCAFYGCRDLEAAPFISQMNSIGKYAFAGCSTIPEAVVKAGVSAIYDNTFDSCSGLSTVVLPDSVKTIGSSAFYACSSLSSITLPASAVLTANNPFNYSCSNIDGLSVRFTPGNGVMADYTDTYSWTAWYSAAYYNKPVTVVVDNGVTNIGAHAFHGCDDLKSVTMGKDVSTVGEYAFCGCQNLEAAPFIAQMDSIGQYAFQSCSTIPQAVVKAGVTVIPANTFDGCSSLATVVLPDSVGTIGSSAFYACSSLSSITLPASAVLKSNNPFNYSCSNIDSLSVHFTRGTGTMADYTDTYSWTAWYSAAYYNKSVTVAIDDGITSIGAHAFHGCDDLKSATVGRDVSTVGDYAFYGCRDLKAAPFIAQMDSIGQYAFAGCTTIPEAVVKAGVTAISANTFDSCSSLAAVVLPDSVETIGSSAFYGCSSLASLTLPASVVLTANNPFNYSCSNIDGLSVRFTPGKTGAMADYTNTYSWTAWYSAAYYNKPVTVVIDNGVTSIGAHVFQGCDDLKSAAVGKDVSSVGEYAFYGCRDLKAAPFIAQIDSIGQYAFAGCAAIPEAVVKAGVTAIPANAFDSCTSLAAVVLPDSVETIGSSAFYACSSLSNLTLPASVVLKANNPFNYSCSAISSLTVRFTPGKTGAMTDFTDTFAWTAWYSAAYYNKPVTIVLDEGVTSIGAHAFRNCDDLASLSIPSTVTLAGSYATDGCKNIKTIYYAGTAEQWNAIDIKDHNSPLTSANVTFSQGVRVSVQDSGGKVLASAAYQGLQNCTVVCTLYDSQGRMICAELKPSGGASFTAVDGAVRARILFLSGDGLVPVRAGETLGLYTAWTAEKNT